MDNIITSQDYIDQDIVDRKIATSDFDILVSQKFVVDGETYQVLLDGHHSFEAARQAGQQVAIRVATPADHDAVSLLARGEIDDFLQIVHMGSDYRFAATGKFVW